jgi:hypothetical protein
MRFDFEITRSCIGNKAPSLAKRTSSLRSIGSLL